jgi:3-oxoacyl-[acyl-carrier-protein] synthase III
MNTRRAIISAIAHYVPPRVVTNAHFEAYMDTSDEWIRTRTGIAERRFADSTMATSDLALPAAEEVIATRGIDRSTIDAVLFATVTPDHVFPATANILQHKLGLKQNVWGFDLSAACSGYLYALETARRLVESGGYKRVLVCGADKMTSIINPHDRATAILFGDAGTATLVEPDESGEFGVMDSILYADGAGKASLYMPAGGSAKPASADSVAAAEHFATQDGQTVFKAAVKGMADVSYDIMQRNNLSADDVRWLVPHQANLRIIDATANRMGIDASKVMINIQKYGNTTAATIPMCLSEWHKAGQIQRGDNLVLAAFGGGFTWGSMWLKWAL